MPHERGTAGRREASSVAGAESGDVDPPYLYADYRSTLLRAPSRPLLRIPPGPTDLAGPDLSSLIAGSRAHPEAADLTCQHSGEPLGQRIIIHGRILDQTGRPLPAALVEIWQANASGRYAHEVDQHPAPLDPNFTGAGFCLTDEQGHYRFVTIRPGAYPWRNHTNAWRPAHVHFSVLGRSFNQRLITQMYFPGDPLFEYDPIFNSVPDDQSRMRLIARFDLSQTIPEWGLAFRFDIVIGGSAATPGDPAVVT